MPNEANDWGRKILRGKHWRWFIWLSLLVMIAGGVLGSPWMRRRFHVDEGTLRNACRSNLKQIHGAKCSWALEHNKANTAQPTASELYGSDKYLREAPECPAGGTYTLRNVGTKPSCSIKGHTI